MRSIEEIARACHEVNRAFCKSIGDDSQTAWEHAPEWQRKSAILGVEHALQNPYANAGDSHRSWLAEKERDGWKFGPAKDVSKKEHPCFVPFDKLPREQQAKDFLFLAVVRGLSAQ